LTEPIEEHVLVNGIGRISKQNIATYVTGISDTIRLEFLSKNTNRAFSSLAELQSSVRAYRDSQKPQKDQMVIPTLDEVTAFTIEKQHSILEAQNFFDYYVANGWHVGNRPMVNWKAALGKWMRSQYRQKPLYSSIMQNNTMQAPNPNNVTAQRR
jgi:hypothetical protein